MTSISLEVPIIGQKNTTEEPKVGNSIKKTEEYLNIATPGVGIGGANILAETIKESNLEAAVVTKLNQKAAGLELKKQAGSATGESGIIYLMETNATTLTLTATATINKQVGIICKSGVESVKLKAGAGAKIFGDFLTATGVTECTIRENQHVIVEADGTNWWIISGEPANLNTYEAEKTVSLATAEAGITISKVRPALLTVMASMGSAQGLEILVESKRAGFASNINVTGGIQVPITVRVGARQVWKAAMITAYTEPITYVAVLM